MIHELYDLCTILAWSLELVRGKSCLRYPEQYGVPMWGAYIKLYERMVYHLSIVCFSV